MPHTPLPVKGKSTKSSPSQVIQLDLSSVEMVQEEEKLNNLCQLLDRLDSTYGRSCQPNSPLRKTNVSSNPPFKTNRHFTYKDENSQITLTERAMNVSLESVNGERNEKEATLSQEEKQSLRKAKKETKKGFKATPKTSQLEQKQNSNNKTVIYSNDISNCVLHNGQKTEPKSNEKSKADLRRERREKQESQRAAKKVVDTSNKKDKDTSKLKVDASKSTVKKGLIQKKDGAISERHLPLLEHLSTPKMDQHKVLINTQTIHPAIRATGLRMKDLTIDGCITRVLATLSAIHGLIEDYQTPLSCDFSRDLSNQLSSNIVFLNECRPLSEPMYNAIRFVRREINKVSSSISEVEAKKEILDAIQTYIHQNIILASEAIIQNALEFLEESDVILTFGFSTLVYESIKASPAALREKISVVVADNPGSPSGVNLLQAFVQLGVKVYYRILPDLPHIINKVTKVVVEAEAVVLNGAVIGQCGLAGLILLASCHSVPIIVLSHTFKFCNIDLTDSLVVNELGDASAIVECSPANCSLLVGWKEVPSLNVVNLIYDVTPSRLINVLVTERNNFPTSVVPVIIKRNYADILGPD